MSTRSLIGIQTEDGRYRAIYAHWDGYPTGNGMTLLFHYETVEKVNALLDVGNVSVLGEVIGEKHCFENRGENNQCTFYGRDRGEPDQEAITVNTLAELYEWASGCWAEYVYVFSNEHWYFTPISANGGYAVYPNLKALVMELVMEV